jgi:hypothetical protein
MSAPSDRPDLRDFQTWMQTFIVCPGNPDQALRAAEDAAGFAPGSAERLVKPSPTLNELERLMIYRRMYPLRMEDALAIDFPVCRKLLGPRVFRGLVEDYVEAHPSTSWTLDHLGRHMVDFVRVHPLSKEYPGLYDLTCLEQSLCEVFNELDSPTVLTPQTMAAVDPESWPEVRLEFIPALRLLALGSNANDLYKAHNRDVELPDYEAGPRHLVVWRQDFQTWRMPLEQAAHAILERLGQGLALGEALDSALDSCALEESQVFEWFNTWVSEGFFGALIPPEPLPTAANLHPT